MSPTTMALLVYSVFRHVCKNNKKVYILHHICLNLSAWLALDGFYISDCMVICQFTPNLVEIGQICRLLPQ